MSLKNFLVAGLFAAAAVASPKVTPDDPPKRPVAKGKCSFHLTEDSDNSAFTPMSSHKIAMNWFDGNGDFFHKTPQHDVEEEMKKGIEIDLPEIEDPFTMTIIDNDGGGEKFQGWTFEFGDQFWTTDEEDWCSAGDNDPARPENGGRFSREYDCSFDC